MKRENQRIAIAQACGHLNPRQTETGSFVASYAQNAAGTYWGTHGIPDYLNDLNAMHEAEKVLRNQFNTIEESYWRNLSHVKPHPIFSTASQRAEAFLRTLNLWTDES